MKKITSLETVCLFLCLAAFTGGCSKNNSGTPSTTPAYLSSARFFTPRMQVVDSFHIDFNKRIIQYTQYKYDTTSGSPAVDSILVSFTYSGGHTGPDSYMLSRPSVGFSETHQLSYDGQNRLLKDTTVNGSGNFALFSYPGTDQACNFNYGNSPGTIKSDTLFITNGNVSSLRVYVANSAGTGDTIFSVMNFAHSSYPNPAYQQQTASTIGMLLFNLTIIGFSGYADFTSPAIADHLIQIFPNSQSILLSFTTDSHGRVATAYVPGVPLAAYSFAFYYY